jgi:ribulose-bisphosphate carboxylase large chain
MAVLGDQSEKRFFVQYRITADDEAQAASFAKNISLEQTVELPESILPDGAVRDVVMGQVHDICRAEGDPRRFDATISYHFDTTGYKIPQFLNVLFGNSSMNDNLKIIKLSLPDEFLRHFTGPHYGIEGLRKKTGIYNRPLACTALKPMGASVKDLAKMAAGFVRGGGDILKDDHGLSDQSYHPFKERVLRCQEAVSQANAQSGNNAIYCPMISGRFDEIEEQVQFALDNDVQGFLIAPLLVGFDTMRYLAERYKVLIIGHPALTGVFYSNADHGITPAVLLGSIFRLLGADISIFVNYGGRFPLTKGDCLDLAEALRSPLGKLRSSFPSPAGGMSVDKVGEMVEIYGKDTVFLISGALIQYAPDMETSTRAFIRKINQYSVDL